MRPSRPPLLPPFQHLLDDNAAVVMRLLVRSVGPDLAEDCFQETWLAALRAYPELSSGDNLRGWLLTIARHKAVDAQRAAARRPLLLDTVETDRSSPPALEPADAWERVGELPPKQRAALALRFAEDRSYADVAAAMGTTQEAARRNVHEGLKSLRRRLP